MFPTLPGFMDPRGTEVILTNAPIELSCPRDLYDVLDRIVATEKTLDCTTFETTEESPAYQWSRVTRHRHCTPRVAGPIARIDRHVTDSAGAQSRRIAVQFDFHATWVTRGLGLASHHDCRVEMGYDFVEGGTASGISAVCADAALSVDTIADMLRWTLFAPSVADMTRRAL